MDDGLEIEELWPDAYQVDWGKLEGADRQHPFGEAAFELFKEAGILTHLAAGLIPASPMSRNEAILSALILKASKLGVAITAMSSRHGSDRQLALMRELIENLATLKYLFGDTGGERFDQYVANSLISEREFLRMVKANVAQRNEAWKIEESMSASIERTAKAAGVDLASLPGRAKIGWPKAEELVEELGSNIYPAYRSGSSVLHTRWHDLLSHHLVPKDDGSFELRIDESDPRPEPLYAGGLLLVDATRDFLEKIRPDALSRFEPQLGDLEDRLHRVFRLHSDWMDARQ